MKSQSDNILSTCDHFRDTNTINVGIKLGFHWQMPHVESASDVHHLHNTEQWKSSLIMSTPDWEAENLRFEDLDKHLPQLRLQRFLASNAQIRRLEVSTLSLIYLR